MPKDTTPTPESTFASMGVAKPPMGTYGVPKQLVSDNSPQFVSEEFETFLLVNGIRHLKSAPYHPATNGLAERFLQSFKAALKSAKGGRSDVKQKLPNFLLAYRNAEHSTTGISPAIMFIGRQLRTRLDCIKPDLQEKVIKHQEVQMKQPFKEPRKFRDGDKVCVRDYRSKEQKWIAGIIHKKTGTLSYEIKVGPDMIWRRHIDQVISSGLQPDLQTPPEIVQPIDILNLLPSQHHCDELLYGADHYTTDSIEFYFSMVLLAIFIYLPLLDPEGSLSRLHTTINTSSFL
ncbi:uncharacterized protein K02A2.6-like [Anneissia japonica]|uniref:uncharacterized protein K02A2.6-like n=1 Tax=Anneissia japonica TaxID=1529436 RepID=UPI001425B1D5|nr:uncharacterized protein K02A2.6-like [Anneissia japonica]